jgi:hypothetical protein
LFESTEAFVEYDLGADMALDSLALLADNNDRYDVFAAEDGTRFEHLWSAPPVAGPGMRWRVVTGLDRRARFIRLSPGAGDASLSVGEFVAYSSRPAALPPVLVETKAMPPGLAYRSALLVFATALCAAVLFTSRSSRTIWIAFWASLVLMAAAPLVIAFRDTWPLGQLEVALTRSIVAAVAAAVILREAFGPRRTRPHKTLAFGALGLAAITSVAAFYNMGWPQFWDHTNRQPSAIHYHDMRVYFPAAKYFHELRYDGVYLASVAAYAEDHGGLDDPRIHSIELRDLHDHRMRRVSDVVQDVTRTRARFSPERWQAFKRDMGYFWQSMGETGYLRSMSDHGANATPAWLAIAHGLFRAQEANARVLGLTACLDPLLLFVLFVAICRSFGWRTGLVCMVVFGANDFYMFGSNWAGATLRHDWMICVGLGVCALKKKLWALGGALVVLAAATRAFPALALVALAVPVGSWLFEYRRSHGLWPSFTAIFLAHRWLAAVAVGATSCAVVTFAVSSLVLGWDVWWLWIQKILSFAADPHVNHVSLLTVTSGSEADQALVLSTRRPFHLALVAVYLALAGWVARGAPPYRVALIGMMMVPVLLYPANYYAHFVFLLPMLVDENAGGNGSSRVSHRVAFVWALLLGLCAAQYFTVGEAPGPHFYHASVLLMVVTFCVLVALLPRDVVMPAQDEELRP